MIEAINGIGVNEENVENAEEEEENDSEEEAEFENTFEKALAEKYAEEIINGHSESCPWRKTGCKDDIYRLPVVRTAWWQNTVRTSFTSVLEIKEEIENIRIQPISASPPADKLLLHLPPTFFNPYATPRNNSIASTSSIDDPSLPSDAVIARALMIALTGWHATCESRTNLLVCSACFQRIGLWMYQTPTGPRPSSNAATAAAPPTTTSPLPPNSPPADPVLTSTASTHSTSLTPAIKSVAFEPSPPPSSPDLDASSPSNHRHASAALDLVASHREHCPYRSPASQAATGDYMGFPAWRILWTTVARYADEQRRRSVASKPEMRTMMSGGGVLGVGMGMRIGMGLGVSSEGSASREEVARADKERANKLKRLRSVLGTKLRGYKRGGGEGQGTWV